MADNGWPDVLLTELRKAHEVQEGLRQRKLFILRLSLFLGAGVAAFLPFSSFLVKPEADCLSVLLNGNSCTIVFLAAFSWLFGGLGFTYAQQSVYDTKISDYIVNTLRVKLLSLCDRTDLTGLLSLPIAIYPKRRLILLSIFSMAGVLVTFPGIILYILILLNYYKTFSSLRWCLHLVVIVEGVSWCLLAYYGRAVMLSRYKLLQKAWREPSQAQEA